MKKFLIHILIFFAIVAVIDLCVSILGDYLQAHAKGGMTKRTNDLVTKDHYDALILGSSRAHHHYDTPFLSDTLGLSVYNAGYDGNGVITADGLLNLVLDRYKPKLVLFDVEPAFDIYQYPNDNHYIRYISILKPYFRHPAVGNIIKEVSSEEYFKVHSGLFRYNSNLVTLLLDNLLERSVQNKGFAPLEGKYKNHFSKKEEREEIIDTFKLRYIENLIATAKDNEVPIVFVASPKLGINNSTELMPVKEICKQCGVEFLDYYTDAEFQNPSLFKEPMHLNKDGARLFSKKIVGRMLDYIELKQE